MKKAPILMVVTAVIGAFFIAGNVSAATVYQQLIDSSAAVNLIQSNYTVVGQFTTDSANHCFSNSQPGDIEFFLQNNTSAGGLMSIFVSTTTDTSGAVAGNAVASVTGTSTSGYVFYNFPLQGAVTDPQCMIANTTYYVIINSPFTNATVKSGAPTPQLFGFITDGGGSSVTIIPNSPGFSDIGVSTSTVYSLCYANLSNATSSSFFSQFEQDVSLGLCQTGVLLFIPNAQALQNFGQILPNLGTKFPFSWFIAVPAVFNTLSATNTNSLPAYSIGLHDLGIGSTTPLGNILPNFTFLSTTTISTYLSDSERNLLINLIAIGLWLGFISEVYFTVRDKSFSHV